MRARMHFSFVLGVIFILSVSTSAYSIDPDLNATLAPGADGQSVTLSTSVKIPTAGSNSGDPSSPTARRVGPLTWSSQYVPTASVTIPSCDPEQSVDTQPAGAIVGPSSETGILTYGVLKNRVTGVTVRSALYCREPSMPSTRTPSFIPSPPTYSQIWQAVYSQAFNDVSRSSGAYIAPASPGLTGLPTHIWAQFPDGQSLTRDVAFPNGYRLRATAKTTHVSIMVTSPKGRQSTLVSLSPASNGSIDGGSFENPAVIHTFSTVGNYVISTAVLWSAENASLSGPGIGTISVPLGSVRLEINRNYNVQQLRPGLTQ